MKVYVVVNEVIDYGIYLERSLEIEDRVNNLLVWNNELEYYF